MKYSQWKIPQQIVSETEQAFLVGKHEVFAIWASPSGPGNAPSHVANVSRSIIPAQTPGATPAGVWVHIEGQELQRIQLDNFRRKERSIIQLHTHPSANVNMSELDRKWEVVRHVGALSIIIPFYGVRGLSLLDGANVYEREENDWRLWPHSEAAERLVVI